MTAPEPAESATAAAAVTLQTPSPPPLSADTCAACVHPSHEHDALGRRFCAATTATSLTRGCICR